MQRYKHMKNTIDKIITVQQALVAKFLKANQDLDSIAMSESELSGITMSLNNILAKFESTGGSTGGGGSQPSEPSDTPTTSILDEIPGANPNYKALYVTELNNLPAGYNNLDQDRIYNNGYYIPVFEDDAPLTERKYVLAVKVDGQICGYRMFKYVIQEGFCETWKYSAATLNENNQFIANDAFEAFCYKEGEEMMQLNVENILETVGLYGNSDGQGYPITIQERDWNTLETLPDVISTEDEKFLFKITGCTDEGESINGYYTHCYMSDYVDGAIDREGGFIINGQSYQVDNNLYVNVKHSFVVSLMDEETWSKRKFIIVSPSKDRCFAYEDTTGDYTGIQQNTIITLKENIGTPTITNLR